MLSREEMREEGGLGLLGRILELRKKLRKIREKREESS